MKSSRALLRHIVFVFTVCLACSALRGPQRPEGHSPANVNATAAPKSAPSASDAPAPAMADTNKATFDAELDALLANKRQLPTNEGPPEVLTPTEISQVMTKANFSSCAAINIGKVETTITFNSEGVVVRTQTDGTPLGRCVAAILRRLKFPAISSPTQEFSSPIYVK